MRHQLLWRDGANVPYEMDQERCKKGRHFTTMVIPDAKSKNTSAKNEPWVLASDGYELVNPKRKVMM